MTYIFGYSQQPVLSTIVNCKQDKGRGCREGDVPDEKREKRGGEQPRPSGNNRVEVWPRNWLVPVILLSLRECTSYGYKLMERAARLGFVTMNPGTLYRTLRHVEKDGLCESERETNEAGRHAGCTRSRTPGRRTWGSRPRPWNSTGATWTPFSVCIRAGHQHGETGSTTMGSGRGFRRPRERTVYRSEQPAVPHWYHSVPVGREFDRPAPFLCPPS